MKYKHASKTKMRVKNPAAKTQKIMVKKGGKRIF